MCFSSGKRGAGGLTSRLRISRFSSRIRRLLGGAVARFQLLDLAIQLVDFFDGALDFAREFVPLRGRNQGTGESPETFPPWRGAASCTASCGAFCWPPGGLPAFLPAAVAFCAESETSAKHLAECRCARICRSCRRAFLDIAQIGHVIQTRSAPFFNCSGKLHDHAAEPGPSG